MSQHNKLHNRKITIHVTPQTSYNLNCLAEISGLKSPGRVVDKLVREKMLQLRFEGEGAQE